MEEPQDPAFGSLIAVDSYGRLVWVHIKYKIGYEISHVTLEGIYRLKPREIKNL